MKEGNWNQSRDQFRNYFDFVKARELRRREAIKRRERVRETSKKDK